MSLTGTQNDSVGEWGYLGQELTRRTCQPWKQVTFVMYLLSAIVGFGGFGVWVEFVELNLSEYPRNYDGLYTAVATFYPALIGSASFQLLLISVAETNKVMTSFVVTVLLAALTCAILLSIFHDQYPTARFFMAALLAIVSMWLWIITDADNPIYRTLPADTPSGGNPQRDLKGDMGGFEAD